jgi:phenylacetate-coenzyme A ligase PaaK-like adenylate-forming protein
MKFYVVDIRKLFWINDWSIRITNLKNLRNINRLFKQLSSFYIENSNQDFIRLRRKLFLIINYARRNTKYYNTILPIMNRFNEIDLNSIPFLTKEIIREKLDDLVSKSVPQRFLTYLKNSGSTGEPLGF